MKKNWLLPSKTAKKLYDRVKDMPIADYHCHLSPKEIYEDKPFDNIGEIWLAHDHYKWRLMRQYGVDEEYITGGKSWKEKFFAYAEAICVCAGNPVYHWTMLELEMYFGIKEPLNPDTAEDIWNRANKVIKEKRLSPRKLIESSKVVAIATTDDCIDSLEYHRLIKEDKSFKVQVVPTFRTDRLVNVHLDGFGDYIKAIADVVGREINDLDSLESAVCERIDYFVERDCTITDVGPTLFPDRVASKEEAVESFRKKINNEPLSNEELNGLAGYIHLFLAKEYKKRNLTVQWHLASARNLNSQIYRKLGPDTGVDCMSSLIPIENILSLLDTIQENGGLPKIILYTLNPDQTEAFCVAAGCFPGVVMGTAWWFCDHKEGITDMIRTVAHTMNFSTFLGMLTDSRSILSYARHDYFRRILCTCMAEWIDGGEYPLDKYTYKLLEDICLNNSLALFKCFP